MSNLDIYDDLTTSYKLKINEAAERKIAALEFDEYGLETLFPSFESYIQWKKISNQQQMTKQKDGNEQ